MRFKAGSGIFLKETTKQKIYTYLVLVHKKALHNLADIDNRMRNDCQHKFHHCGKGRRDTHLFPAHKMYHYISKEKVL